MAAAWPSPSCTQFVTNAEHEPALVKKRSKTTLVQSWTGPVQNRELDRFYHYGQTKRSSLLSNKKEIECSFPIVKLLKNAFCWSWIQFTDSLDQDLYSLDSVNSNSLIGHHVSSAAKIANLLHLNGQFLAHQNFILMDFCPLKCIQRCWKSSQFSRGYIPTLPFNPLQKGQLASTPLVFHCASHSSKCQHSHCSYFMK